MTRIYVPMNNLKKFLGLWQPYANSPTQIILKPEYNKQFLKYWQYVSKRCYYSPNDVNYLVIAVNYNTEKYDGKINLENYSNLEYFLLFEFPDDYPEEELFYFKLKYC